MDEKRTILFVDDEVRVLRSIERGLIDQPYHVLFAETGEQALEILRQHEVHVLVTDMRMPEMTGLELLQVVREHYPHIVRIVLSGYTQVSMLLTAINQGKIFRFISKPWRMEEDFIPAIREAVEQYDCQTRQGELPEPVGSTPEPGPDVKA